MMEHRVDEMYNELKSRASNIAELMVSVKQTASPLHSNPDADKRPAHRGDNPQCFPGSNMLGKGP